MVEADARIELRGRIAGLAASPPEALRGRPLSQIHSQAASLQKAGALEEAAGAYAYLFAQASRTNVTHPDLHAAHGNASGAYLALGLPHEALSHADRACALAERACRASPAAFPSLLRSRVRRGRALLALGAPRKAAEAFDSALHADPLHAEARAGAAEAAAACRAALEAGTLAAGPGVPMLPAPPPKGAPIEWHPAAAPLHRVRAEGAESGLPLRLLTPRQAETDPDLKDAVTYATVTGDVAAPARATRACRDVALMRAFNRGICAAVAALEREDVDVRALDLSAGSGALAVLAHRAGARHVTAADRWLYCALSAKRVLEANGVPPEAADVVHARATDLSCGRQGGSGGAASARAWASLKRPPAAPNVPGPVNLVLATLLEDGLLGCGLLPALAHVADHLATPECRVVPERVTVWAQAVQVLCPRLEGFSFAAADARRGSALGGGVVAPGSAGRAWGSGAVQELSRPVAAFSFSLRSPPREADCAELELDITSQGRWNAVRFWFDAELAPGVVYSSGPEEWAVRVEGSGGSSTESSPSDFSQRCLQPAAQYLPGEQEVSPGQRLVLRASHNTVRLSFSPGDATALRRPLSPHPALPPALFSQLADARRARAYSEAISKAVARLRVRDGQVHALDAGAGAGLLSLLAARAGADSVVAAEVLPPLADLAREAAADNGLSRRVAVVCRDLASLQRGREIRALGVNLVVCDLFDASLLGDSALFALDRLRRTVAQADAVVVPAAATVYAVGLEVSPPALEGLEPGSEGVDLEPLRDFFWDAAPQAVRLARFPHRQLTRPARVAEVWMDGRRQGGGRDSLLRLEVVRDGTLNAVAFWFDLHLDEEITLSNRPPCLDREGENESAGQAQDVAGDGDVPRADLADPAEVGSRTPSSSVPAFEACGAFEGARAGRAFKLGDMGLGYYADAALGADADEEDLAAELHAKAVVESSSSAAEAPSSTSSAAPSSPPASTPSGECYWGQALQWLDSSMAVRRGKRVSLVSRREAGAGFRFSLRAGAGERVPAAPWKEQWGGGVSVENPHVQRVKYCELLVTEFLQRVPCGRFPPIARDMGLLVAHSGPLGLEPAALQESAHRLCVLEQLHATKDGAPLATADAVSRQPLEQW